MLTDSHPTKKPVRYLKGIGPKREEAFKKFGIETLADLFYFFPRRYEDRSHLKAIRDIRIDEHAVIQGRVIGKNIRMTKFSKMFELFVEDKTSQVTAVWFNQPYLLNTFAEGDEVILSGKVEFRNRMQITNPEYEIVKENDESQFVQAGRIVPIYPLTEGLVQRAVRVAMKELVDHYVEYVKEFFPKDFLAAHSLMELPKALQTVHFPETFHDLERGRHRLIFEELFFFEFALLRAAALLRQEEHAIPLAIDPDTCRRFKELLPFSLTDDQEKVLSEITSDVSRPIPMTRLLQGEVGSGKTIISIYLLLLGTQNGIQGVFMAPTEVLAEQQFKTIKRILEPFGVRVALLTGSLTPEEKTALHKKIAAQQLDIIVGTHALLQDNVTFKRLGLVVIDEQHKFGVRQRNILLAGQPRPHLLVMSATPIPRTLGLTLFGDMDISTIRQLPKGRKPVKTYWISKKKEKEVWTFVGERVRVGLQAYIICPRIDETEGREIESAVERHKTLSHGVFKKFQVGLIHGRMNKPDVDRVMTKFLEGSVQILISTSMVEVGLDNPKASIMVVEDADRFGLAQLHQMRGRVGRGSDDSYCFLLGDPKNKESCRRLRILTKTNDGFQIAEEDFKLRGPGDFLGTRQSGLPWFRLAEFPRDISDMVKARDAAGRILRDDLPLAHEKHAELKLRFDQYRSSLETPA